MMGGYPIARVWSGHVPAAEADGFHRHLLATGVADVRAVEGSLGAIVLRRAHLHIASGTHRGRPGPRPEEWPEP